MLALPPERRPTLGPGDRHDPPPVRHGWIVGTVWAATMLIGFGLGWACRPAATGRLAPPALGAVAAAAPLEAAAAEPARYRQELRLSQEIAELDRTGVVAALGTEQGRRPAPRVAVLTALLSRFAELDPAAAAVRAVELAGAHKGDATALLSAALGPWFARDRRAAENWSLGLPRGPVRDQVIRATLHVFAESDPREALRLALEQAQADPALTPLDEIFSRLAAQDPRAALEAARQLPNQEAVWLAAESVAAAWATQNPLEAYAGIKGAAGLPAMVRDRALLGVYRAWSATDPVAAGGFLLLHAQDADGPPLPAWANTGASAETIAAHWAQHDPRAALAWTNQLPARDRGAALKGIMDQWGADDPRAAAAYAAALPAPEAAAGFLDSILEDWVKSDLPGARQWVRDLPPGPARAASVDRLARTWFDRDPQAALEFAFAESDAEQPFGYLVANWTELYPDRALAWTQALPPSKGRDAAMASILGTLGDLDPARGAGLFGQVSPVGQPQAARKLVDSWVGKDPAAAAAWVGALTPGEARDGALWRLAEKWSDADPRAACAWLAAQPADLARDTAVLRMVDHSTTDARNLSAAIPLAESIQDPGSRDNALEGIARAWLKTNAAAAGAWIGSSPDFTPRQKAKLVAPRG